MNTRILLLALSVAALSSCSSMYKSGQTPDDVYYSPARPQAVANNNNNDNDDEYVNVRQPKQGSNYQSYEQYQDNYRDDRFLRMSIGNPYYLNSYNSYSAFDWRYNSYYNGFNYGFSSPWNNYFAWNSFYNPYALSFGYGSYYGGYGYGGGYYGGGYHTGGVAYTNYRTPISRPVTFNVNSYAPNNGRSGSRTLPNNSYYNNAQRYNNGNSANNGNRSYYNNGNTNSNGNRSNYTPANTNSNNNSYTPSRSYTPSSSGSSGGSSGGGGGAVSRPTRGN